MARLVEKAQTDTSIKVILIHGGLFYSSGNDISRLAMSQGSKMDKTELRNALSYGCEYAMTQVLKSLNSSVKPIVGLIRGAAIGIGFTTTAHFDFIYCTPEA